MRYLCTCLMVLFGCVLPANALTELAGDLSKDITIEKSPYLVIADLFIPVGKIVHIEPGVVFLFKNFTGLHVSGILIANGTAERPIVFTSENNHIYNPATQLNPTPYDWNGIYIHKDGIGTDLKNCKINFSVKGIISETKFIKITNGIFEDNGRSNMSIEGNEIVIQPSVPFNHNISIKDATVDGVPVKILKDPDAQRRNEFRYVGLSLLLSGAAVTGYFGYQSYKAQKDVDHYSNKNNTLVMARMDGEHLLFESRKKRKKNICFASAGGLILIAGTISFVYSFTF